MPVTTTARINLNAQGLLIVRINDGAHQTLDDARENLAAAVSETGGKRRPLLIDIRTAKPLDADARHHYSGQTLVEGFSALALRPGIPTQLFSDETQATRWLNGHL